MLNILYLVHRAPYPPDKGDRVRSFHILRFLRGMGRVWLGCLSDGNPQPTVVDKLRSLTHRLEIAPMGPSRWLTGAWSLLAGRTATEGMFASRQLSRTIAQWARETRFDAIVVFCTSMAQYLRPQWRSARVVLDFVDVDSEKWFEYAERAAWPKRLLYNLEGRRLRRLECRVGQEVNVVTVVTEPEADIYRALQPNATVHALPNGVNADYFRPMPEVSEELACVFVGSMDYRANEEGVCWFVNEVWPTLRQRRPPARFLIVGRNPTAVVRDLTKTAGVEVIGDVPDVRPYFARCAVSVAPLRVARGVQNKVLEAMAMRKAVVASPQAMTGLAVEPGRQLLCASSPNEWIDAVDALLQDPARRYALGAKGREYVNQHHVWDRCLQPLAEWIAAPQVVSD